MDGRHVALVTGASRGIGAAIARALAASGVAVVAAARGAGACAALCDELRAAGADAWPLALDVTDPASVKSGATEAARLAAGVGPVDWLVNNAGIAVSAPALAADAEELNERQLAVNYHGARRAFEALAPAMVERGYGRVVNVASSAALGGYAYVSAYCASKHALLGYTRAVAHELAKSGVGVCAVCPHYVDSPMLAESIERVAHKTGRGEAEARAFFERQNPGGRLVTTDEVAAAVVALLRDERTGVVVELDGGEPRELESVR